MCICLVRGSVGKEGGEWVRGLGFINPVGTRGVLNVCVFWLRWGMGRWLVPGSGGVGWCYESGFSV